MARARTSRAVPSWGRTRIRTAAARVAALGRGWPAVASTCATDAEVPAATLHGRVSCVRPASGRSLNPTLATSREHGAGGRCRRCGRPGRPLQEHPTADRRGGDRRGRRAPLRQRGMEGAHPLFEAPDKPLDEVLDGFATCSRGPASGATSGSGREACSSTGGPPRTRPASWSISKHATPRTPAGLGRADPVPPRGAAVHGPFRRRPGVRDTPASCTCCAGGRSSSRSARGRTEMDLGGVDIGPDHREPVKGDAMAGLYEHKRSFGAGSDDRRARTRHPAMALRARASRRARGQVRRPMTGTGTGSP